MNRINLVVLFTVIMVLITSCEKNAVLPSDIYACSFSFQDSSAVHPKASIYQNILDDNRKNGLVGAILLVKDTDGLWIGSSGKADIASNVDMKSCNSFLIASISKVFTASAIYRYIDKGVLTLQDPINKWIPRSITDKINNANKAKIGHLLSHTSGIADYYTLQFDLDRINRISNNWSKEDVLKYTYGVKATNEVGETYYYSNTNFLLLSIILENASGLSFKQVYQQEVFSPLNLSSAYYSESNPIPEGCVKGYVDIYGKGLFPESEFLYKDELGIGGDGGIAINVYDLGIFLEKLMKGDLISSNSLSEMTNWFDLPDDWHWDTYGQNENGYGIEKFNTSYGYAVGHTGEIDGYSTYALYYPEYDMTYILLVNSAGDNTAEDAIFMNTIKEMFE